MAKLCCPRCEAIAINGFPCHELGCPNEGKPWRFVSRGLTDKVCIPKNEEPPDYMKKEVRMKRS